MVEVNVYIYAAALTYGCADVIANAGVSDGTNTWFTQTTSNNGQPGTTSFQRPNYTTTTLRSNGNTIMFQEWVPVNTVITVGRWQFHGRFCAKTGRYNWNGRLGRWWSVLRSAQCCRRQVVVLFNYSSDNRFWSNSMEQKLRAPHLS